MKWLDCRKKPPWGAGVQPRFYSIADFAKAHRRSVAWAAGALVLLAFFLYVVVPFIASTRIVKERIAFEMSMWSGYRVTIGQDPRIKLFPFRAVLDDVSLSEWTHDGAPVLAADEVILNLSPLAALVGDIYFYKARFEGFLLRVRRNEEGLYLPRLPGGGRMANAIKDAWVFDAAGGEAADLFSLSAEPFGRLHFTRGRVIDEESGKDLVTGLSGALVWPRLDKSASLAASGDWNGENVAVEAEAAEPMTMLTGGSSQITVAISGGPGSLDLDGTAKLSQQPFFAGRAAFSTPSLPRMLEWSGTDLGASPKVRAVRLESRVQGDPERIKFEDLQLALDEHSGTGVIEVMLGQKRPALSGTLAFQQLNLDTLLSVFTTVSMDPASPQGQVDTAFAELFDLDLRVSATQATTAFTNLADLAATAQIRNGLAVFDISDARAFGGTVQAGLRLDRGAAGTQVEASLRATDIDGGAFGRATGLSRLVPAARGNLSLLLKGPVERWDRFADRLAGSFSAAFGAGTLAGIDLAAFLERTRQRTAFALSEAAAGTLAVDRLQLKGTVSRKVAQIERAEIRSGRYLVDLSGSLSLADRRLALTGAVREAAAAAESPPMAGFSVGGSWAAPSISPRTPAAGAD